MQIELENFPLKAFDKIRYADTDRQGHVNNATFSTYLETGRVELLYNADYPIHLPDTSFVIASLKLDFLNEIKWPGQVDIGTGVLKVGNSSFTLYQMLYQKNSCVARAETVIVQVFNDKSGSAPLSQRSKEILERWLIKNPL